MSGIFTCFLLYFFLLFLGAIYNIWNQHVVISENEIVYWRLGLEFKTAWEDFETIGNYLFQEGLFVDKSQIKIRTWFLGTIETYIGFGQNVFIPISFFSNNWRNSELGQQIKQYAPHLFKKENNQFV